MKQTILTSIFFMSFLLNNAVSQSTRINTPMGNSYIFTTHNLSFNGKSIVIGENAGKLLPQTFQSLIFIGNGAGEFTANATDCIGIGGGALSNTSGYRNTAIGTDALKFNSKWDNIALGTQVLRNNQNGIQNIGIGSYALRNDIVSSYNIAIGYDALRDIGITGITGNHNVAIGVNAQEQNRIGVRNVTLGSFTLADGISASDNTALGYFALHNTAGNNNVAVGSKAFNNSKEVSNSVAVGFEAGSVDTLGSNSVYIGYQAGSDSGGQFHAKSGNVFIGYRAGYGETVSNKLFIDNSGTSAPLIEGDFDSNTLEVNGAFLANGNSNIFGNFDVDGTLNISENATFDGTKAEFIHGNNSSSGLFLENNNSHDYWRMYVSSSTGDLRMFNNANGGGTTLMGKFDQITGAYSTPSDSRLKTDVRLIGSVLPSLMSTSINSYKFKTQTSDQRSLGVMAQEVKELFPELVHYDATVDSYTVDYAGFSMVALKAIQEQQEIIEGLISRLEKLENEK